MKVSEGYVICLGKVKQVRKFACLLSFAVYLPHLSIASANTPALIMIALPILIICPWGSGCAFVDY